MFEALRGQREALRSMSPETLLLQIYSLKIALAFGLGAVILAGGDQRFNNPSFQSPRDLVSWTGLDARVVWGILFLALGAALVFTIGMRLAVHVLRFGMVVYMFLVVGFIVSVINSPAASLTGIVAYGTFGIAHALVSVHLDKYGWN